MRQRDDDVGEIESRTADVTEAGNTELHDAEGPEPSRAGRVFGGAVAALCVTVALVHVLLVFLHVAPSNAISQQYGRQIEAWVDPFFRQSWKLFAPNPGNENTWIYARTGWTTPEGERRVSDWIDISAFDREANRHQPFPSRTTQNMLRVAWNQYLTSHGDEDVSRNDDAIDKAKYLRNIAVQRLAAHHPHPYQAIRLMAASLPVVPSNADSATRAAAATPRTRLLPWWNVTPDGN